MSARFVPSVDAQLAALDSSANPQVGKLKTRWDYLKAALVDLNSQSSALESASGRPFAPTTVYRHTRSFDRSVDGDVLRLQQPGQ